MLQIKDGKRKVVASALTLSFFLQQSFCLQVLATNIPGAGVVKDGNVYNISPDATNGDIGFRKGPYFNLSEGDIANLIFHDGHKGVDIKTFLNLIDNQININGIVNSVNKNGGFTDGHVVFISPKGMVVGSSGVLNVGSLSVYTPDPVSYEKYKSDVRVPSLTSKYEERLGHGDATVKIDGSVLARNFVNIDAANVDITNNALVMAGVKDATKLISHAQAEALFDKLVNTDNMNANSYINSNGNIKIVSYGADGGTNVAGTLKNFGKGNIEITNEGSKGITVSGKTLNADGKTLLVNKDGSINVSGNMQNKNGVLSLDNTGDGILIASAGKLTNTNGDLIVTNTGSKGVVIENGALLTDSTNAAYITNSGADGVKVRGNVNAKGININNKNSDVVIGYNTGKNYLNSTGNVNINVDNGNVYNYGTKENLIKANGNLDINTTNGAIGKDLGNCDGGVCTGIGTNARDLTKSVNTNVKGTVKAISSGRNSLVNLASLDTNLNVDQIKADGKVILLADSSVKGSKAFDIVNRASDKNTPNVEGTGISIISSGNIGETGKALTFRQNGVSPIFNGDDATKPHVLDPANKPSQGVDMLAIKNINVKGMDADNGQKLNTNVCAIISRTGDINAEFSGDTYIRETTAANNIDITTRGKNMYIENLGIVPTYPQDYYGPNTNIAPNKVKLTALDLGSRLIPSEAPEYEHAADSTIVVKNGRINGKGEGRPAHEQDLTLVADNAYAGGYYFNMGKHRNGGKSTVVKDDTTNPFKTPAGEDVSIRGKAVRPEDVTAIGEEPEDRNYYYGGSSQGDDPNYDGVQDPDKKGTEEDDDNLVVPETDEPDVGDTDNDTDLDSDIDTDLDSDTDIDNDTDMDSDSDTDTDDDNQLDTDTDNDTDNDTDTDMDEPDIGDTDSDSDTDADSDTDLDSDTDIDNDTDMDNDSDTDTDDDSDDDNQLDTDTDNDTDNDTDTDMDEPDIGDTDSDSDTDADSDTDLDSDTDIDNDTDMDNDSDTDTDTDKDDDNQLDTDTDNDTDNDTDTDMDEPDIGDTDSDSDTDADSDTDLDSDTDIDNDTDMDSDTDTDSDSDSDSDNDSDSDIDSDTDNDTDNDTDIDTDTDSDSDMDDDTDNDTDNDTDTDLDNDTDDDITIPRGNLGKEVYKQRVVDNPIYGIDKRQYMRFSANDSQTPINLAANDQISSVLDISRGGMAVSHNNNLKVGDVVPVQISYGDLNINTDVKIVSATDRRAGTEFINLDQATANKILYMNIMLKEQMAHKNNNLSYLQ